MMGKLDYGSIRTIILYNSCSENLGEEVLFNLFVLNIRNEKSFPNLDNQKWNLKLSNHC